MNIELNKDAILGLAAVLGRGRLVVLGGVLAVNVLLALAVYGYVGPGAAAAGAELRTIDGQIQAVSTDVRKMRTTLEEIDGQKVLFDQIAAEGFFTQPRREGAEDILREVERLSGVLRADVSISRAETLRDREASKSDRVILKTTITADIDALDDIAVYRYIAMVTDRLPGYVALEGLEIDRRAALDAPILRAIRAGEDPVLVEAKPVFAWYTMVPDPDAGADGQGGRR